ncbi:MAG: hypothetical protein RQ761_09400 [Bacteroidales bacterium]|nr:hypothetical protein [Bacteroidales bacterium]
MEIEQRIEAFAGLGNGLNRLALESSNNMPPGDHRIDPVKFDEHVRKAVDENAWFIPEFVRKAISGIALLLDPQNLYQWTSQYNFNNVSETKTVAVVMAGNVPAVGFHDFLSVLMAGHRLQVKLSSNDRHLIPAMAEALTKFEPGFTDYIEFTDGRIHDFDAVIATGSNNTARYFNYYFAPYPHIIRKNRNAVAVLTGNESNETIKKLGEDIFLYFGLGCRNVSKIYIPEGFDIRAIFPALEHYTWTGDHHKYRNNYDYNKSVFLVNGDEHYDNGFLLLKASDSIASPVSVLHYEQYADKDQLNEKIAALASDIQCVVSEDKTIEGSVPPGKAQYPELWDYADGVDTMSFLLEL